MNRMAMRSREAPMDWEREGDQHLPNVLNTPSPSLEDGPATTTSFSRTHSTASQGKESNGRGVLGSFASEPRLNRASSFAGSSNQSSPPLGWESTMSKPFQQDSQSGNLLSSSTSPSGFGLGSRTELESSPGSGGRLLGSDSSKLAPKPPPKTASFDLGMLRNEANMMEEDDNYQREYDNNRNGGTTGSGFSRRIPRRSNGQNGTPTSKKFSPISRSATAPLQSSRPWGNSRNFDNNSGNEGEEDEESNKNHSDGDMDGTGSNDEDQDHYEMEDRKSSKSSSKAWGSSHGHVSTVRRLGRRGLSRAGTGQYRPPSSQDRNDGSRVHARPWSENVDLPYIVSGYVQVALNATFICMILYIIFNFATTIQSDVNHRVESYRRQEMERIQQCRVDYNTNLCVRDLPALRDFCMKIKSCMEEPEPWIARTSVAAETFANIVNAFVNTMSYKALSFFVVLIFGAWLLLNYALYSYRSNHVIYHQHSVAPPTRTGSKDSAGPPSIGSNSNFSSAISGGIFSSSSTRRGGETRFKSLLSSSSASDRAEQEYGMVKRSDRQRNYESDIDE
ncbi:hypothetical protein BGW38_010434 [Lunasporangiospora selenospora]|uniref:Brl1/Brr6 domain-containing protein n=1 Tax=Lunasporangiospora selenospora TaxID=979761 RepID=A0A9P6FX05_9FUNG|nr:hypothetical protein BGW38_010434 [Lunasporangiospora selenospora]